MDYEEVAREIIGKQEDTIGMIATRKAEQVENIEVNGEEIVFKEEATIEDIKALMEQFKKIQGQGAVGIARKAVSGLEDDIDIDLPEELQPDSE